MKFLNGFVVPKSKTPELLSQLAELQKDFQQEKDHFLNLYDETIQDWATAYPGWEHILRTVVPQDVVESKIGFDFQAFTVSEPIFRNEDAEEGSDAHVASAPSINGIAQGHPRTTRHSFCRDFSRCARELAAIL